MITEVVTVKQDNLKEYVLKNFEVGSIIEVSYNRVFVPGKILVIDEKTATLTVKLKGQLLNQTVDLVIDEIKDELLEIILTNKDKVIKIVVTD